MMQFLLDNFDTLAEIPGGTPKLREIILQIAVRGELTRDWREENPNVESASVLLEKIRSEKIKLEKEGKIKKQKPIPPLAEDEIPCEVPETWEWCRLKHATHDWGQKRPDIPFLYIDVSSIDNSNLTIKKDLDEILPEDAPSRARKIVKDNTVIFSTVRPYLRNCAVFSQQAKKEYIASTAFAILAPFEGVSSKYLLYYLTSDFFISYTNEQMIGMAYPAISEKNFFLGQLPLPPCSEQRAIVQRVDHLMQHCDAYEAEQNMRESARQKAVKANFNTLSNSSAVEMQEHWERVKNHFGDLYKTTGDVAELKAAILQLAVRGELTRDWREQNPDVEPASVLLEKIKVEKQKLEKGGQIRKQKTLPLVSEEEAPYEIGATWKWVRWGDISHDIQYGFTAKADFSISEVCYLRITDIQEDAVNWSSVPGCEIESNQIDLYRLNEGDLVVARTGGTIGKTYLVKGVSDFNAIFASYLIRISVSTLNIPKYVKLFSLSSTYWDQLYEGSKGTGQPNVNGRTLGSILFPLPPQSEQKVIVKRVNQLMQLSDEFDRVKKQVVSIGNNLLKSIGANM